MISLKTAIKKMIWLIKRPFVKAVENRLTVSLLSKMPPPNEKSKLVFVFSGRRKSNLSFHVKLFTLIGFELAKRGIPSYFIFQDNVLQTFFPQLTIDNLRIAGSVTEKIPKVEYASKNTKLPQLKKYINLDEKKAIVNEINFFPIIECTLRTIKKRYNINFNDADIKLLASKMIQSCSIISIYFYALRNYAKENNKQIALCGWESNYIPNGAFKLLCDQMHTSNHIQYIDLNRSYIHYFGEHPIGSNNVCAANLTKKKIESRLVVTRKELDAIKVTEENRSQYSTSIEKAINKKSSNKINSKEKIEINKLINQYQINGKLVFVLFAHLFYDVRVNDSSPAFTGMSEWITETVRFFKQRDDLLLLKPHPREIIPDDPANEPDETLSSMVGPLCPSENIQILHPLLFSIQDLSSKMSCGLVWRSSVAMELTYLNVPCIIAGMPPYRAIRLCYSQNKEHYFNLTSNADSMVVTDYQVHDVIRYTYCLENQKSHNIKQIDLNGRWNRNHLHHYRRNGDDQLKKLTEKILGEV